MDENLFDLDDFESCDEDDDCEYNFGEIKSRHFNFKTQLSVDFFFFTLHFSLILK